MASSIEELLKEKSGIRLDIGGGGNPTAGFVNMDARDLPNVDVRWDVTRFPWPLPDESVLCAIASHLVEHIPPDAGDARIPPLVKLLIDKGVITEDEVATAVGEIETGPRFIRFMNEVWRILKPGGEFAMALPHGYSSGFLQDPTHCNALNEATWGYFDPALPNTGFLYGIYFPLPWKVKFLSWEPSANIEVVLIKRSLDEVRNGS